MAFRGWVHGVGVMHGWDQWRVQDVGVSRGVGGVLWLEDRRSPRGSISRSIAGSTTRFIRMFEELPEVDVSFSIPPELYNASCAMIRRLKQEYNSARRQQPVFNNQEVPIDDSDTYSGPLPQPMLSISFPVEETVPIHLSKTLNLPDDFTYPDLLWSCPVTLLGRIFLRASAPDGAYFLCQRSFKTFLHMMSHANEFNIAGSTFVAYGPDSYAKGLNRCRKLGVGSPRAFEPDPIRLPLRGRLTNVWGSDDRTYFSMEGEVYACGANDYGMLGVGLQVRSVGRPRLLKLNRFIQSIVPAPTFTLVQDTESLWYVVGDNSALALPVSTVSPTVPCRVGLLEKCSNAFVSSSQRPDEAAAWFIGSSGTVYGAGDNRSGQLGVGPPCTPTRSLKPIVLPDKTRLVVSDSWATFFVLDSGSVYSCGWNRLGQLAIPPSTLDTTLPQLVTRGSVAWISTGHGCSAIVAVTGHILLSGTNGKRQLSLSNVNKVLHEKAAFPDDTAQIVFADGSTFIRTTRGAVYVMGLASRTRRGVIIGKARKMMKIDVSGVKYLYEADDRMFAVGDRIWDVTGGEAVDVAK
ncbi:hypothetical protein J8273_6389 [Carpediemonas membranifera]|uniref:Uncharacterized protein n=1 Tax=Carpediemonas membranifera TaxID=201153 RepID=A0A8J6B0G8_9EUKA|nr:hypothetical protein J8273_6389 [Carpediemonas membranifera]|eukprot:KAG9391624.1 hypothetical protein J8273_6389 [Carpediemonas membranifera]